MVWMACSQNQDQLPPVEVSPVWDTSPLGGCPSPNCEAYPMPCDAAVSVRIVRADNGDVIQETCDRVVGADACSLFDLSQVTFFEIPPEMVRIQVAAWRPEVLDWPDPVEGGGGGVGACPTQDIFDLQGVPRVDFVPQPAFGGAAYFDVTSSDDQLAIPLACTDPDQVNDVSECDTPDVLVTAVLDDVEGLSDRLTEEQARSLFLVAVAEPRPQLDGMNNTVHTIDNTDIVPLTLKQPIDTLRSFQGFSDRVFDNTVCVAIQDNAAQPITVVSCEAVTQSNPLILTMGGHFMPTSAVEEILTAALGQARVPETGFVIGRVVDETGEALAGVSVGAGLGTVQYLNASRTALTVVGSETTSSGFFISTDSGLNTNWTASHLDGRVQLGTSVGGLIQNRVTVMTIRMGTPVPNGAVRP